MKRLGITGVAVGVLSLLACELPLVLALVGLGGLSSAASAFFLPPVAEMIGIVIGVLGLFLILGALIYRVCFKVRQ